jgi:hypothetical protein
VQLLLHNPAGSVFADRLFRMTGGVTFPQCSGSTINVVAPVQPGAKNREAA